MGYIYYFTMRLRTVFKYRVDTIFRIIRALVSFFTQIYLWKALYGSSQEVAGVSIAQMMTFVVVTRFINSLTSIRLSRDIEDRVKSGEIATDLIRPMDIRLLFASRSLGDSLASLLLDGIPVVLFCIVYLGGIMAPASPAHFMMFVISTLMAIIVNISLELLIGTLAFWYMNAGKLNMFVYSLSALFSGGVVPLWFLPSWLKYIAYALPLQAINFIPMNIYLGNVTIMGSVQSICVQAAWAALLLAIQSMLWSKILKKIVLFGG